MADIIKFVELRGYTYEDKEGIVKVYTREGQTPPRRIIFKLLAKARKALIEARK